MAEITLSTLILFFLALPGFVARSAYHSDEFSRTILPSTIVEDLMGSLLFAFPLHFICLLISEGLHHGSSVEWWPWLQKMPDIDFVKVVRLMAANFEETGEYSLNGIVNNAYTNWSYITAYAAMIHLLAWGLGTGLKYLVWKWKWDLKSPVLFRFRNYWLYRLTGRGITAGNKEPNVRFIQILVEIEGQIVLYSGMLLTFIVDEKGELLDLLLVNAERSVGSVTEKDGEVRYKWLRIPGSIFALKYEKVINLNLYYYHLASDGKFELLQARQLL